MVLLYRLIFLLRIINLFVIMVYKDHRMKSRFAFPGLICFIVLFSPAFAYFLEGSYWERQLSEHGKFILPVAMVRQSKFTSCGPASIVMAFNYADPEKRVTEEDVIEYAAENGYYTEHKFPYTSPDAMILIAEHYAEYALSGTVQSADEGFALLKKKLLGGDPVVIDILTRLDDPNSGAHFVVVTGLEVDEDRPAKTKIYFNDPLWGKRSSYWLGDEGIWNGWKNNNDPGGSGWWMAIPSP